MRKLLIILLTLSALLTGCGAKTADYSVEVISLPEQMIGMADVVLSEGFDTYKFNNVEYLDEFVEDVSNKMGIPDSKSSGSIVIYDANNKMVSTIAIEANGKSEVKYNYITAK